MCVKTPGMFLKCSSIRDAVCGFVPIVLTGPLCAARSSFDAHVATAKCWRRRDSLSKQFQLLVADNVVLVGVGTAPSIRNHYQTE